MARSFIAAVVIVRFRKWLRGALSVGEREGLGESSKVRLGKVRVGRVEVVVESCGGQVHYLSRGTFPRPFLYPLGANP